MSRFKKIGAKGKVLAADAKTWEAVLDTTTGLMWTTEDKKVANYGKASAAAKSFKSAGFKDWRLPTVEELFLLADRSRFNPAIDKTFFPDCQSSWYWTSTPAAYSPAACAWVVGFGSGYSYWNGHNGNGFVRAVRPSQSF